MAAHGSRNRKLSNQFHASNSQSWSAPVSLIGWLEDDADLIAVVDGTQIHHQGTKSHSPSYINKALRCSDSTGDIIYLINQFHDVATLSPEEQHFQAWFQSQYPPTESDIRQTVLFENHVWSTRVLHDRWIVVRGVPFNYVAGDGSVNFTRTRPEDCSSIDQKSRHSGSDLGAIPHTEVLTTTGTNTSEITSPVREVPAVRCFMSEPLSAHQAFVRDFDWAATLIGPMSTWKSQLVESVSLTLTASEPAAVFWGTEMISVYNEAFINIAGQKHPAMMGDTPMKAFAEVWDQFFEDRIQLSRINRKPFSEDGLCLLLERLGYPEETFMTFTFLPLLGYSGEVVGFYHTVTEVTQQTLSKRRMSLLLSTSNFLSRAQNLQSFWKLLIESLHDSEFDTPFVVLYSVTDQAEGEDDPRIVPAESQGYIEKPLLDRCQLEGCLGYPPDHEALLSEFQLHGDDSAFAPCFRASMNSRAPRILKSEDGTLPASLVRDLNKRGYSDECKALAICPLRPTKHDTALGFLAIGLSSRRPCDEDYQSFLNLLVKNISSSLASVVLLEDEKRRGLNNAERAAFERAQLTARLQERELENQLQEHKFMLMAQQVPVGIFDLTPLGEMKFCNQAWYDMTRQDPADTSTMAWINVIHDDDHAQVLKEWTTVSVNRQPVSFEGRLKTPWRADSNDKDSPRLDSTWFLARMYPVIADDSTIANVIGSITDVSFQKYSMVQQIQRVEEAVEAKRQQENFIDMTSHEMRNPLNAMLLCAEELCVNLQQLSVGITGTGAIATIEDAIANSIESAETIIYCGRHQKRIIDDVLTLSKLDARLLQIIPIEVQPISMVEETLKLFESEVRAQGIDVRLQISDSLQILNVVNVLLDPSRVVQILVNFVANAIKFIKTEDVRQVLVRISASHDRPSSLGLASSSIQLIPHGGLYQDPTTDEKWGTGEPVYLQFVVRDTGPGISSDDMMRLFGRFTQARPKTHAHYGGSGLGLFISQQLAELQGGRVGIASEPGVGSSFYFYVKTRHAVVEDIEPQSIVREVERITKPAAQPLRKTASIGKNPPQSNATGLLVVEDNLVNQRVLKRQLQKLGYNVLVANHGEEALEILRQSNLWRGDGVNGMMAAKESLKLHLILMDIEMPVMDGRECIQRIREYERQDLLRVHVPVIALTANARPEQISGAKTYGFDEVISKPFQLTEVVRQIGKFLEPEPAQGLEK